MKILIAFFILLSATALFAADVTKMIIEHVPAVAEQVVMEGPKQMTIPAVPESYVVTTYGLKDKGAATVETYKSTEDMAFIKTLEGAGEVSATGRLRRVIIDFNADGSVYHMDVQKETANTFEKVPIKPSAKETTDAVEAIRAKVDPIKDPVPDPIIP